MTKNFHTCSTKLEELQQEINAKNGNDFCKDDKLLTELFLVVEATTNKDFAINICLAKTACQDKNMIINNLKVLYPNMVADGIQKKVSSADSKIITLTTQVKDLKKQLGESNHKSGWKTAINVCHAKTAWITGKLQDMNIIINNLIVLYRNMVADGSWKKVSSVNNHCTHYAGEGSKETTWQISNCKSGGKNKAPKNPTKGKKEERKNWRYTKIGDRIKCPETGATLKWCPLHCTSPYMPSDYNHKAWLEKKKRGQEKYKEQQVAKKVKLEGDKLNSTDIKVTDKKHLSKLQLSSAFVNLW